MKRTFLGLLYIIEEMLEKELLQYDPNNKNNMLVYRSADDLNPEGWYTENIHTAVSELFNDVSSMELILEMARDNNIDIEHHFTRANNLLN